MPVGDAWRSHCWQPCSWAGTPTRWTVRRFAHTLPCILLGDPPVIDVWCACAIAATITSVMPNSFAPCGGTLVTISGSDLGSGATVTDVTLTSTAPLVVAARVMQASDAAVVLELGPVVRTAGLATAPLDTSAPSFAATLVSASGSSPSFTLTTSSTHPHARGGPAPSDAMCPVVMVVGSV